MQARVKRIGYFGDSKSDYIVKMNKMDRQHLGLQKGAIVKVKKGNREILALIRSQFIDLIAFPEVVAVNKLLAEKLKLRENDTVQITADVTTEQAEEYASQKSFEQRQVLGALAKKKEKKSLKKIMEELFADEDESREEDDQEEAHSE